MSGVLPFNETYYSVDGDVGKVSITCCLQDTSNFYCAALTKIPPKTGQIGRGKRGERLLSTKDVFK
ncbi:calcium/calmodulin-dependent protein kinase II inhibitor 1b [Salmo salar]|uniref:Calcium/calmodulin-dependent protein kinase II inhibitor 1b n=1 Tax=Salmo salar TaxID=8030 RepID=A0ABM3D0A6_SALSA|nr:calcium/calmodulin-dependent protein kinase II inhibitor 1b [Salmo salar]